MEWLVHSQTSAAQIWMTLTCWPGNVNGAWVESASHVTRIGQIGMEPWSGHCKNFKRSGHCKNFKRPAWLDFLTWKQCVTYRDLMSCVYALYQANRSNRHRTEYDLDLLTWKWCVMRHPSMGFICASYEVNRSNSQGADITKTSDNPCDFDHWPFDAEVVLMTCMWATYQSNWHGDTEWIWPKPPTGPCDLHLWNGNGVWHIMTSWVVFVPHIDGLVQERRNSSVLAMELRLSCIDPSV